MNNEQKKSIILDFLDAVAQKDYHLVNQEKFDTSTKMWSSRPKLVSDTNKTLMKVYIELERLGKSDIEILIDSHLNN